MYFKCDVSKITSDQLAVCMAVETLYREQSMPCTVLSLKPITFDVKPHFSERMRERLLRDRVCLVIQGYKAELEEGNQLVISPEKANKPIKRKPKGGSESDADLLGGQDA
jgi:hypothetical protein